MRTIEHSSLFRKDYKRILKGKYSKQIDKLLPEVLNLLVIDANLPIRNRDHDLVGNWSGYRECHLKPDLLLIYSKPDSKILRLARLGSHSHLFN